MLHAIYLLHDPRTGEGRYVGKASNLRQRMWDHHKKAKQGRYASQLWILKLFSLGLVPHVSLLQVVTESEVNDAERRWIAYYRVSGARLLNLVEGGEGGGFPTSKATREKLRCINLGKKLTVEHKKSISSGLRKYYSDHKYPPRTQQNKDKIRATLLGRKIGPCSESRKAAISVALVGRKRGDGGKFCR